MRITRVQLTATDPRQAGRSYARLLGAPVREVDGRVHVQAGASELVLVPGRGGPGVHHVAFTVSAAGFERAAASVAEQVGLLRASAPGEEGRTRFEGPPHWNSSSVYFPGPDAAVLELIVRRDLPDPDLGDGPVVAISEVGVATTDVPALVTQLRDLCGLAPFGPPSPAFAPVGDQHGLLICVDAARTWTPEHRHLARGGPLQVTATTPAGTATLTDDGDPTPRITVDAPAPRA